MKYFKLIIINYDSDIVDIQLNNLKEKGYIEVLDVDKKNFNLLFNFKKDIPQTELKEKIIKKLNLIGVPKNMMGYNYILSAILYLNKFNNINNIYVKEIYNELFHTYNKSVESIEKAIRKAIECTFAKGNINEIYNLFNNMIPEDSGKISNKKFIYELAKKII